MARASKSDREAAIARLHEYLNPGDTVYAIVRHVSRSGMSRVIQFLKMSPSGDRPYYLGLEIATALGWQYSFTHNGVKVQGCGMDMAFHTVYTLGRVMWPNGVDGPDGSWLAQFRGKDPGYVLTSDVL